MEMNVDHWWVDTDWGKRKCWEKKKPVLMSLWSPQIPHRLTRDRGLASAVGGRRLKAWATTRPSISQVHYNKLYRFRSCLIENTVHLNYKDKPVKVKEIIAVCCENHTEHINTLCERKAEYKSLFYALGAFMKKRQWIKNDIHIRKRA
jgi:hypothetical protein